MINISPKNDKRLANLSTFIKIKKLYKYYFFAQETLHIFHIFIKNLFIYI